MIEKTKQKQGGSGVGRHSENGVEYGKCKDKKCCCGEVKNFNISARHKEVKLTGLIANFKRGLRSLSSLGVVSIRAIEIFIRGCYL